LKEATTSYECVLSLSLPAGEERTLRFGVQGVATGSVNAEGSVTVQRNVESGYIPDRSPDDNSTGFKLS
jgi:hypothetical protein